MQGVMHDAWSVSESIVEDGRHNRICHSEHAQSASEEPAVSRHIARP